MPPVLPGAASVSLSGPQTCRPWGSLWEHRATGSTHHTVLLQSLCLTLQPGLQGHLLLLQGCLPAQALLGVQLGQLGKLS
jgi:hypothetical protein